MKILVYGAGVLGCNLARNLLRAGKDVTLLARGNWAAEIKQNGLRIKDKFSLRTSVSRIPVVTELAPDAMYDVIFVVLRYTQLDSVLDALRANRTAVKMIAKTWLKSAKIKDVGAYFAVSDAKSELSPWDSRLQVSSRGYMLGYNDLKDPSVSGFFRFLAKVGDNGMKMQIVKIGFGDR